MPDNPINGVFPHPQGLTGGRYDRVKHGFARKGHLHPMYTSWQDMHKRCYNETCAMHHYYEAKGITVCDAWKTFAAFASDMGALWQPGLTLERRDNAKGYCVENCYWATRHQQARNRDYCRYFEFNGERLHVSDWAAKLGCHRSTLLARIDKLGWSVKRTLTTPARSMKKKGTAP